MGSLHPTTRLRTHVNFGWKSYLNIIFQLSMAMVRPEDLEYVNLENRADVQQAATELSQKFSKHLQNCREVLSDLKVKHVDIRNAAHNISALLADIKEAERLLQ